MDLTPLAFIETNIVLSKFDSKFKSIDSADIKADNVNHLDTIDRMKLIQTAWLKGAVKFNLFSIKLRSNQYFQLNVGGRINVVNADSLYKKETDVIFFDYYPEILYSIKRLKNFGADLSLRWLFQRLADKESFANRDLETIFNPQASFYYYPSSNSNNRIYLRFNYFANRDKLAKNFYQFQFGYKTSLKLSK